MIASGPYIDAFIIGALLFIIACACLLGLGLGIIDLWVGNRKGRGLILLTASCLVGASLLIALIRSH